MRSDDVIILKSLKGTDNLKMIKMIPALQNEMMMKHFNMTQ